MFVTDRLIDLRMRKIARAHNQLNVMIQIEHLSDLQQIGYTLTELQIQPIRQANCTNTSSRRPISYYYDETIGLVAQRERLIIDKYDYHPPQES